MDVQADAVTLGFEPSVGEPCLADSAQSVAVSIPDRNKSENGGNVPSWI